MAEENQTSAESKKAADVNIEQAVSTPKVEEVITGSEEIPEGVTPIVLEETPVSDEQIEASKKKVAQAVTNVEKATAALEEATKVLENESLILKALEEGKPKPFYENKKKRKFRFSKTAPQTMNLQGKKYSQEEIITTAELIDILIDGNSSFVEPIY